MAERGIAATVSLAGRVATPLPHALPIRTGGFGGAEGLAAWLGTHGITHLIDASHPFAAQMSRNAVVAAEQTGIPLAALTRPAWTPQSGDDWTEVPGTAAAVASLAGPRQRVFLAIGSQTLSAFAAQPQHYYLLRLVDPPETQPPLPDCHVEIARGPFTLDGDLALLRRHRIQRIVAKNSGGTAARAKLDAARILGLPVTLIARPALPPRPEFHVAEDILAWLEER